MLLTILQANSLFINGVLPGYCLA